MAVRFTHLALATVEAGLVLAAVDFQLAVGSVEAGSATARVATVIAVAARRPIHAGRLSLARDPVCTTKEQNIAIRQSSHI